MCRTTDPLAQNGLQEALEMIPEAEKVAYRRALALCSPEQLQVECPAEWFLARDAGNPWASARRLCLYWQHRVELFGETRAFLPLLSGNNDVGESALNDEDLDYLQSAKVAVLTPHRSGTTVLYWSHLCLIADGLTDCKLRCLYYLIHKGLQENSHSNAHRIMLTGPICKPTIQGYDMLLLRRFFRFNECLPMVVDQVHLSVAEPAVSGRGWLLQCAMKMCLACSCEFFGQLSMMKIHWGCAEAQGEAQYVSTPILAELLAEGFSAKGLHESMGGSFNDECFHQWLARQRRLEQQLYLSEEERARRQRERNRYHSRKKRARRQNEFHELKSQHMQLLAERHVAMQLRKQLERRLEQAQQIVREYESERTREVHEGDDSLEAFATSRYARQSTDIHYDGDVLQANVVDDDQLLIFGSIRTSSTVDNLFAELDGSLGSPFTA